MAMELGGSFAASRDRRCAYSRAWMPGVTASTVNERITNQNRRLTCTFTRLQQMRMCLVQRLSELELCGRDERGKGTLRAVSTWRILEVGEGPGRTMNGTGA